jgi:hypothetical protein
MKEPGSRQGWKWTSVKLAIPYHVRNNYCSTCDPASRKQAAGSRKQEAGSRKQEAGSRKQEAGSRKQTGTKVNLRKTSYPVPRTYQLFFNMRTSKPVSRKQEAGNKKQEAGSRKKEAKSKKQAKKSSQTGMQLNICKTT